MSKKEKEVSYAGKDLVDALNHYKHKLGHYTLLNKLQKFQSDLQRIHEAQIVEMVFNEINQIMNINLNENNNNLNNYKGKRDYEKQFAICFACTILKDEYIFSLKKIGEIFNLHLSNVSRRIKFVRDLKPSSQVDKPLIEKYNKIVSVVKGKKQ